MHFFFNGLLNGLLAFAGILFIFWIIEVACKCHAVYKQFHDMCLDIREPLDRDIMKKVDVDTLQLRLTEIKGNGGNNASD